MTAQLLEELKQVSKDLLHSTEADYQIEPFVWEVAEKGELTLDKLLHSQGFLRQVEIEQVFPQNLKFFQNALSDEEQAEDHKQLEVINFLRSRCKSLEVYLAQKNDGSDTVETEFEEFPLILAETEAGDWIGIAPKANAEFETRLDAERLVTSYDPHLEQRIWQSAFWKLENVAPPNRADFYVRFDLESLLRNSGAPIFSYATNTSRLMDFLARDENVEELLEYHACQRAQMSESTVFLTEEIKKCLVGMKLFTRQFYEPHQAVDLFVMRAAASKEILGSVDI